MTHASATPGLPAHSLSPEEFAAARAHVDAIMARIKRQDAAEDARQMAAALEPDGFADPDDEFADGDGDDDSLDEDDLDPDGLDPDDVDPGEPLTDALDREAGLRRSDPSDTGSASAPQHDPTPAPTRSYASTRYDGWTVERQRCFLATLAESGSVVDSARSAGMTARSAHRLRSRPDANAFAAAWDEALTIAAASLVDLAFERATIGAERVTTVDGEEVRRTRVPSDRMLCFLLTHLQSDRFGHMARAQHVRDPFTRQAAESLPRLAGELIALPDENAVSAKAQGTPADPL